MNGLKSNIGGKNSRQMQQGAGIPTLRIQADTPVPRSSGNTPVPGKTDKVQLPALSTTPRIVQQGKPCSQTTPRIPHPNQVNNFYRYGNNKNDLNGLGPMCFGINQRKDRSNMGHNVSCMQQPQNSNLHIPNRSLENATPTPSEVSDIITPRNGDMTPKVEPGTAPYHNGTNTDKHVFLEPLPVTKQEWNPYKPLGHIQNSIHGSVHGSEADRNSLSQGMNSAATVSLSPYPNMETSPSGSQYTSPRYSANRNHGTKRALSISPIGSDGMDLYSLIRTSPTSLVAYINGSRSSSTSASPQPGLQHGHFGHLIAHRTQRCSTGSPYSGSGSSKNRMNQTPMSSGSGYKRETEVGLHENLSDIFPDIVKNQVVVQQSEIPFLEQRAMQDMQMYHGPRSTTSANYPPPTYNQAVSQQPTPISMMPPPPQPSMPPPSCMTVPPQPLAQHNTNSANMMNNNNPLMSENSYLGNNIPPTEDGEVDENGEKQNICKWIDCNQVFKEQEDLVRHLEKAHIDQRKGEDFTCFWSGCQRRYKPFNARYKLLIHMRVHSGEKPNKCTFEGCTKAFSRLENLKIHLRSHTGERPYICQHAGCAKAFSNSSDRAKHQRTHLDTKPYACQVAGCTKRYTDPSSLRKHVKNHNQKDGSVKKKLKKETDMGGVMLNDCLQVQQMQLEQMQQTPPETVDMRGLVTGPTTDLYSVGVNYNSGNTSANQSPGPVMQQQNSPLNTSGGLSAVEEERFGTFSPAPPSSQNYNTSRRHFIPMRTGMPPVMRAQMHQQMYPNAYQQYIQEQDGQYQYRNNMYDPANYDNMHRIGGGIEGLPEDFNMSLPCAAEEQQTQQYLQHTAIDRCNSRLSAIYADGTT